MNLKKHNITNVRKSAVPEPGGAFLAVSDVRVRRLSDALSPDGAHLLTAAQVYRFGAYGVVRRWRLWPQDPPALLDEAERADHLTRPLSAAQLAAFSLQQ